MFAVGLFASLFTQKDILKVLAAFVGMMGISALIGTYRLDIPFIEAGIVASIILFGVMIVFAAKIPYRVALGMIGMFAMFHGYAHGFEFSGQGAFVGYLAGFSLATLAIHLAGLGVGRMIQNIALGSRALKLAGGAIALGGLSLI
jgi:urease accessory protein